MNKDAKIDYYITYIGKHPNQSGNEIYNRFKGSKYGMRKKDFYKVYRNTKGLRKPTPEKSLKSVPTKYKSKVKRELKREKEMETVSPPMKKEYTPFFRSLEDMVLSRMGRYVDNYRDLQYQMHHYNFNHGGWPSNKQVTLAWNHLKHKGLTSR